MSSKPPSKPAAATAAQKNMSNRLLTMKFMQRSAAAAPKSKANTAAAAAATAVAEEEARQRETAAARIREAAGESAPADSETHWQLSTTAPRAGPKDTVIKFALSELRDVDSGSEAEEEEEGRLVFGGFRKKEEKKAEPEDSDSEDDDSEDEGKAKTPKIGKKKKTADVSLAGLTSISNAGNQNSQASGMKCFTCGGTGHPAARCPQNSCYNCGEKGHRSADCMAAPKKKRRREGDEKVLSLEDGEGRRRKGRISTGGGSSGRK